MRKLRVYLFSQTAWRRMKVSHVILKMATLRNSNIWLRKNWYEESTFHMNGPDFACSTFVSVRSISLHLETYVVRSA